MDHDFDADEFLQKPLLAHLATASGDGPRESPVWFVWEAGGTMACRHNPRQLPKAASG